MKTKTKIGIIAVIAFLLVTNDIFAQPDSKFLNTQKYYSYFPIKKGEDIFDNDYVWSSDRKSYERFAKLDGKSNMIDTYLEFSLLSYYSKPVIKKRPAQADAILPVNDPKLADQKLGAAVFQEIQILRFLDDPAAVFRHETILKFITDRKNATRQEIETFYRDNVSSFISTTVDEEFKGITVPAVIITAIKQTFTDFYLMPNQANFDAIKNVYSSSIIFEPISRPTDTESLSYTLRNITYDLQDKLNESARKLFNITNNTQMDSEKFESAYIKILNMFNIPIE